MIGDRIRQFIDRHHISGRVVVACSGGADSTALLLGFSDLKESVVCVHVNHHLRGAESDADEQFVRDLCARLGVEIQVADGTLDPETVRTSGIEAAARKVRDRELRAIADRVGARYVATAHQKNDQAETIVMRIVSGTGIAGLRGILPVREDGVIRPLLNVTRVEIEEFLSERGITPRIDRMNSDPRFMRNRVRAALREFDPTAIENVGSLAEQAQQVWPSIERLVDRAEASCAVVTEGETRFQVWPDDPWLRQALLYRHIRRLGNAREVSSRDLERLAGSLDTVKRVSVTKELELIRRAESLILRRAPRPTAEFELSISLDRPTWISAVERSIRVSRNKERGTKNQLFQLPGNGEPTFTARNRRDGDRFQPLGMHKHKKLKDFLIDRKIPAEVRDRIPLLVWHDEIVWVGGVAVSERFKVTSPAGGELYEVVLEDASQEDQDSFQR